jgi:mRNA interferase MazF
VICDFGDVVVVPFPFVDRPITKRRPALVLSRETFNAGNGHSILAMITTAAQTNWPSDVELAALTEAGLDHRSVVRWKLFTVPNDLILRRIGGLAAKDRTAVVRASREILAAA